VARRDEHEHVFEVLAAPTSGPAVHVAAVAAFEPQSGTLENPRIELTTIVDDDEHRRAGRSEAADRSSTATIPSV